MPKIRAEECVKATCMGINSLTPPRILHSSKEVSTALSSSEFSEMEVVIRDYKLNMFVNGRKCSDRCDSLEVDALRSPLSVELQLVPCKQTSLVNNGRSCNGIKTFCKIDLIDAIANKKEPIKLKLPFRGNYVLRSVVQDYDANNPDSHLDASELKGLKIEIEYTYTMSEIYKHGRDDILANEINIKKLQLKEKRLTRRLSGLAKSIKDYFDYEAQETF